MSKTKYLSYAQATAVCNDFKHLIGSSFMNDAEQCIDMITVAPYPRILRWQFLQWLVIENKPLAQLLSLDYGGRYDVVVVSKTSDEPGYLVQDLRTHLTACNIPFDPERYACLKRYTLPQIGLKELLG